MGVAVRWTTAVLSMFLWSTDVLVLQKWNYLLCFVLCVGLLIFIICRGSISEESETNSQWQTEGRRLVPTLRRHISHTSHASSARNLLRPERPANLRSAAAATAAAPVVVTQGAAYQLEVSSSSLMAYMKVTLVSIILSATCLGNLWK